MSSTDDAELASRLASLRPYGQTYVCFAARIDASADADVRRLFARAGLQMPEAGLSGVAQERALRIMQRSLHRDLAYAREAMSLEAATSIAYEFLGRFADDATFATNEAPEMPDASDPVTNHLVDRVVVGTDNRIVGLLAVADND